jgi:hypothetical protein
MATDRWQHSLVSRRRLWTDQWIGHAHDVFSLMLKHKEHPKDNIGKMNTSLECPYMLFVLLSIGDRNVLWTEAITQKKYCA